MAGISGHIRSHMVGYVALFVALSGTAWAANGPLAGRNTVGSADIINGEVKAADVADAPSGSDAINADTLDGLTAADFAPAGRVQVADRQKVNDPTPGDLTPATVDLFESGPVSLEGECTDNSSIGGEDRAEVRVRVTGPGNSSVSAIDSSGAAANIETFGGSAVISGVSASNASNSNLVGSVYFVVVEASGEVVSGTVSMEINDGDGGGPSDCTFAATGIG